MPQKKNASNAGDNIFQGSCVTVNYEKKGRDPPVQPGTVEHLEVEGNDRTVSLGKKVETFDVEGNEK